MWVEPSGETRRDGSPGRQLVIVIPDVDARLERSNSGRAVHVCRAPFVPIDVLKGATDDLGGIQIRLQVYRTIKVPQNRKSGDALKREIIEGAPPREWDPWQKK
jgi:hypothetical protein